MQKSLAAQRHALGLNSKAESALLMQASCRTWYYGQAGKATARYEGYSWVTVMELLCMAFQSGPFGENICGVDYEMGKAALINDDF